FYQELSASAVRVRLSKRALDSTSKRKSIPGGISQLRGRGGRQRILVSNKGQSRSDYHGPTRLRIHDLPRARRSCFIIYHIQESYLQRACAFKRVHSLPEQQ